MVDTTGGPQVACRVILLQAQANYPMVVIEVAEGGALMNWTLPENLKKLKEMAELATPGPWTPMLRPAPDYEDHGWRCLAGIWGGWMVAVPKEQIPSLREADESNTLFIVAAREALPQLIQALEKKGE